MIDRALGEVPAAVIGSVKIPDAARADVDHVVVTSDRLILIDSKLWHPGLYWTRGGTTRRNLTAFPEADKRTMGMAVDRFARAGLPIDAVIVVHTNTGQARLRFWQPPDGVESVAGPKFMSWIQRRVGQPSGDPNPELVAWVSSLRY